jgi:hypothetical protein
MSRFTRTDVHNELTRLLQSSGLTVAQLKTLHQPQQSSHASIDAAIASVRDFFSFTTGLFSRVDSDFISQCYGGIGESSDKEWVAINMLWTLLVKEAGIDNHPFWVHWWILNWIQILDPTVQFKPPVQDASDSEWREMKRKAINKLVDFLLQYATSSAPALPSAAAAASAAVAAPPVVAAPVPAVAVPPASASFDARLQAQLARAAVGSQRMQVQVSLADVLRARLQQTFATAVRRRDRQCVVTGTNVLRTLQAAHVVGLEYVDAFIRSKAPNRAAEEIMDPANGVLLRADCHLLFDTKPEPLLSFELRGLAGAATVHVRLDPSVTYLRNQAGNPVNDGDQVPIDAACVPFIREKIAQKW